MNQCQVKIATALSAELTEKSTGEMESKKINLREKGGEGNGESVLICGFKVGSFFP